MTQDKLRRIITAVVSACTVLLTFLTVFLAYQWITIAVLTNKEKSLKQDIAQYEEIIEEDKKDKEYYESELYKNYAWWQMQMLGGNK